MKNSSPVRTVSDVRAELTTLIRECAADPEREPILVGSHRRPQAALVPYQQVRPAPTIDHIRSKVSALKTLATAHGFSTISVIGSVARGESTENSDVDLLCDSVAPVSVFAVAAFETDAEQLLNFPVTAISRGSLVPGRDNTFLESEIRLF